MDRINESYFFNSQNYEEPRMDKISLDRIQKLHPLLREEATCIYKNIWEQLTGRSMCRITFTLRSMSEQAALYAQGRTTPGPVVTHAKPGHSYHNYGLAIDFALIIDGKTVSWNTKTDFDQDKVADWMEVVNLFKQHGWEWGGDWKSFKDYPHLQKTFGFSTYHLRNLHNTGKVDKQGYVIL